MTKLTEDILRAQTCPFEMMLDGFKRTIKYIGEHHAFVEGSDKNEHLQDIEFILDNYKLPEPEPNEEKTGYISSYSGNNIEIINEGEWDAEIYALLLIESGVIYE